MNDLPTVELIDSLSASLSKQKATLDVLLSDLVSIREFVDTSARLKVSENFDVWFDVATQIKEYHALKEFCITQREGDAFAKLHESFEKLQESLGSQVEEYEKGLEWANRVFLYKETREQTHEKWANVLTHVPSHDPPDEDSGWIGVYQRQNGKFYSKIHVNNRKINVGTFKTAKEAACTYDEASRRLFGPKGNTNFDAHGNRIFYRYGRKVNV